MADSDSGLVSRAKAGDVPAFEELVSRHQERVFALAYHILGNAEDAADVQQETFVCAWTKLRAFRGDAAFGTWVHRITVNACISRKRRKDWNSCQAVTEEELMRTPDPGSVACQERIVNAVVVRDVLAAIPASYRTLLILREVEGMSSEEISRIVGGSVESVRKQLWRVRKLFRELLRRQFEEDEQ